MTLVLGCSISLLTMGSLSAPLVVSSMVGWAFAPLALAVGVLYIVVMVPVMTTPPLGPMLTARLQPWLSRMPRLARHLIKPANALAR